MKKKLFILAAAVVLLVVLTSGFWLKLLGEFLIVDEKPLKSDAIVVISGEIVPRVAKGVELFREGYGRRMVFSGGGQLTSMLTEADLMKMEARYLGITGDVFLLENRSRSTYENALFVREILLEENIRSFVLVTSNFHTRRSKFIFGRVLEGTGINFTVTAAPDSNFNPDSWWKDHEGQQKAMGELASLFVYWIKF